MGHAKLDLNALDSAVEFYLALATQRSYNSTKKRYASIWVAQCFELVPASEQQLRQFVVSLAKEGVAHSTLKCYLAAIRHLHIAKGVGDPAFSAMPRLVQVLRGTRFDQR